MAYIMNYTYDLFHVPFRGKHLNTTRLFVKINTSYLNAFFLFILK